jgi:hypothetical protein
MIPSLHAFRARCTRSPTNLANAPLDVKQARATCAQQARRLRALRSRRNERATKPALTPYKMIARQRPSCALPHPQQVVEFFARNAICGPCYNRGFDDTKKTSREGGGRGESGIASATRRAHKAAYAQCIARRACEKYQCARRRKK